jgi:membrane-bound lytic murein transglycosylase B
MKCGFRALVAGLSMLGLTAVGQAIELTTDVKGFIDEMVSKHRFDRAELTGLLQQASFRQDIIDAITRPAEAKPWYQYRSIFLTSARAEGGATFWRNNRDDLRKAEELYGVPPEIIVAIIGVETRYGANTGRHRVLDALSTLAFGYPPRSGFFRKELEQFLLMAREEGMTPTGPKGSYAGALGKAQFIPSSFRAYAVDFDGDGKRDLWDSNADAIGSVANYFVRHGWRPGEPVTVRAGAAGTSHQRFVDAGMKPSIRVKDLYAAGITTAARLDPTALTSLIKLETADGHEYWLGLHNFYVITRYNHSNLYAMAVYQLSQEILEIKKAGEAEYVSH